MSKQRKGLPQKFAPLTDIEWTTLWMAMRYAMGRETIAASTLPGEIAQVYYHRLTEQQRRQLVEEIDRHEEEYARYHGESSRVFGDPVIDAPHWRRFRAALDTERHQVLSLPSIEGSITAFECDGDFYSLHLYLRNPLAATTVRKEFVDAALIRTT